MTSAILLTEAIRRHAAENGSAIAFEWMEGDRAEPARCLSYFDLHRQSGALAQALLTLNLRGERVLLPFPPGLDFIVAFVGCLRAGAIPVPTPFPQNRRTLTRTQAILEDCQPALCLAPRIWLAAVRDRLSFTGDNQTPCVCAAFEDLLEANNVGSVLPQSGLQELAYLQYTSGTGGAAKGVMVSHANLSHNIAALQSAMYQPPSVPLLSWLPHYHDMQLVVMLARSMMIGSRCVLMSPVDFVQRPLRWLRAIARSGAYLSGGPNFAYEHCVQRITEADLIGLDFSRWKIALNSSESVRPNTMSRFERLLAGNGFVPESWYPAYGLAEATALVAGVSVGESALRRFNPQSGQELISCGRAALDDRIFIVDPTQGTLCSPGEIGEICVAGAGVTRGYWARPEARLELFYERLPGKEKLSGPLLRTGDLGFLDEDEHLFFAGRIKDLIVIRGVNHHSEEIEASLQGCHPALRSGELAVFSADLEGETREQLVVVAELGRTRRQHPPLDEVVEAVQTVISREHELVLDHLVLLKPGALAKTTSGKIQRGECRRDFLARKLASIAEWHRST